MKVVIYGFSFKAAAADGGGGDATFCFSVSLERESLDGETNWSKVAINIWVLFTDSTY